MPFGLTNAPATFCTLHNELFHPYLDDWWYTLIVGYSHSLNDHVSHLRAVFKEESPLCKEREMLLWTDGDPIPRALDGHQSHRGVASTCELRSFLGLVNYYRRFIVSYSKRAAPLKNILKKLY